MFKVTLCEEIAELICANFLKMIEYCGVYTLFISNTFISNARSKMAKNKAKFKQHPEAELSLIENYLLSSFPLSSKNNSRYSKKHTKKQVSLFQQGYMINTTENETEKEK